MLKTRVVLAFCCILILAASLEAQYTVLHEFTGGATDGSNPDGSLIRKGTVLYGMTERGGALDNGTIFKINLDGTGFAVLHSFTGETTDGANPYGSLILADGKLYGMTLYGGANGLGIIFRINRNGTGFTVLHSFTGGNNDGLLPYGTLTFHEGKLYGMTFLGGTTGWGIIFSLDPTGTGFTVLHSFAGGTDDGADPLFGSLTFFRGKFYGLTYYGGSAGQGVLFQIGRTGKDYKVLHNFLGGAADGAYPQSSSITAKGSTLYGMTEYGGAGYFGTIFKMGYEGDGFNLLHSFPNDGTDGYLPAGALTRVGSELYALTSTGGTDNGGILFRIKLDGSGFEVLRNFEDSTGAHPYGNLIRKASVKLGDRLYGMTHQGGSSDRGVIFAYQLK